MRWFLTVRARLDIGLILSASGDRFGSEAQRRYRMLLEQAIEDVAADPQRSGVQSIAGDGLWLYHSRHARIRTPLKRRVARPRHLIVFSIRNQRLEVLRVLHDAMDLPEHLKDL